MTQKKDKAKNKSSKLTIQDVDNAWIFLERAFEESGYLFPTTVEAVKKVGKSTINSKGGSLNLPKDVNEVLKRGEEVARRGLMLDQEIKMSKEVNNAFAAAARNGKGISSEVLERMHVDRKKAERKENK